MKIQKLECPYCTGPLHLVKGQTVHYCPHCGKPLAITDGRHTTINQNIRVEKDEHIERINHIIDEGKVLEERRKIEEEKTSRITILAAIGAMIFILLLFAILDFFGLV